MRRHRFYLPSVSEHIKAITDPAQLHQMRDVLRVKVGDELLLWKSGKGADYVFEITHSTPSRIEGIVSSQIENDREPQSNVSLYCALLKRENFEWVLQKGTEVGVSAFYPILTERTIKMGLNRTRCESIIQEAAEQSGRGVIPMLCDPLTLDKALRQTCDDRRYFFHTPSVIKSEAKRSREIYALLRAGDTINIFIGPEGGWTDDEVEQAQHAGCIITSLGPLVLRAETAAIVASYLAVQNNS